jgi:hypothetical protein
VRERAPRVAAELGRRSYSPDARSRIPCEAAPPKWVVCPLLRVARSGKPAGEFRSLGSQEDFEASGACQRSTSREIYDGGISRAQHAIVGPRAQASGRPCASADRLERTTPTLGRRLRTSTETIAAEEWTWWADGLPHFCAVTLQAQPNGPHAGPRDGCDCRARGNPGYFERLRRPRARTFISFVSRWFASRSCRFCSSNSPAWVL